MKILVINTVRFKLNGISAVIKNYYTAIDKDDLIMDFIAIDNPSPEYMSFFAENKLCCNIIYKKNIVSYFIRIIKLCRKEKYDIVHIHGNSANMAIELFACLLGGVKVRIAHSHNTSSLHPLTHNLLFPFFTSLCTNRLACGEEAGKWLYHSKDFHVLKNGIHLSRYKFNNEVRCVYRKKIGIENQIVIGHIGNFIEQKNHAFMLEWFSELINKNTNYRLLLISDGALLDDMIIKAKRLGISDYVIFLGKTLEVQNYLQAMDVFVLPSLHEGLPVVLVEAQASGLPCIVSDCVARESDLTNSIQFVPITSTLKWVDEIVNIDYQDDRNKKSENNILEIRREGYDIKLNANELKEIYYKNVCKLRE